MKKFKAARRTALSLCIATAMFLCMIISSSALDLPTFTGTIVSDTDISGIEIKVYSAEPVYNEEGRLLYYAETYASSVYTDSEGIFEFEKPSEYCSYTVNMATLPAGYGVSKRTQFIVPSRTSDTVDMDSIAYAETMLDGRDILVIFKSADGKVLSADYEVVPDSAEDTVSYLLQSIQSDKTSITYDALKKIDTYTYRGTIVTKGKNFRYSETHDISDLSEMGKANYLYLNGIISESEKNEIYEDYLNDMSSETEECGTDTDDEFSQYSPSLGISSDTEHKPENDEPKPVLKEQKPCMPVILNNYFRKILQNSINFLIRLRFFIHSLYQ